MRKRIIAGCLAAILCGVLLASCGNTSSTAAESAGSSGAVKAASTSENQSEEKQPYEILREEEGKTKQIAADEEQQAEELKEALGKLTFKYGEDETLGDYLAGLSPNCEKNEEQGKSCIAPVIYIFGPSVDPVAFILFNYIGDEYLDLDTVEVDTDGHRYTYGSSTFAMDVRRDKLTIAPNQEEKTEEKVYRIVTEDDLDVLVDMVKSDGVGLTFAKYNTAKPEFVECEMPEEDRQAITDALNAYYLYLNASEKVRAKALADISYTEVES